MSSPPKASPAQSYDARVAWPLPTSSLDNETNFPQFGDGDVVILLSGTRRYQLHADTLRRASSTLRNLLTEQYVARLSKKAVRSGKVVRSRLVLVPKESAPEAASPGSGGNGGGHVEFVLQPSEIDTEGRPMAGGPRILDSDVDSLRNTPAIYTAYDNVLGALYNRPMDLGDFDNDDLGEILGKAVEIANVAEYLGVEHIVLSPIEATLQATGQKLYRTIAQFPTVWLEFSYRIRSRAIFKEAIIHAIGKYNDADTQRAIRERSIPDPIIEILVRRGEKFKDSLKLLQRRILSFYPREMQRRNVSELARADTDRIGRSSYANDIFWWMAVTVYRSWMADKLCMDATHNAPDLGFALLSRVSRGGDAYIDRGEINRFCTFFPLSNKGLNVIDHHLAGIKEHVKTQFGVGTLFRSACQLDVKKYPQKHFTCAQVGADDYPFGKG